MNWSRTSTLISGMSLIGIVNAVALLGVAYNRSGEPESALLLSEREFYEPSTRHSDKENSGLTLHLQWRMLPPASDEVKLRGWGYFSYGGAADWLNEAKMVALGFESPAINIRGDQRARVERQLARDVLLVLELNGKAYQEALARAVKYSATGSEGEKLLKVEQTERSRLFVVDAGQDGPALRAQYPDRNHYAIVRGQVRPVWQREKHMGGLIGYVSDLSASNLNVPLEWKSWLDRAAAAPSNNGKPLLRYEVEVKFGQRLEPWITGAANRQP